MKRGTPEHPKMYDFAARLGIPRLHAVGMMECLWQWAAKFVQQGNIGKYPDDAIARQLEWTGDPGLLIKALTESKWLDRDRRHRLLLHDWHVHCENSVKKYLKDHGLTFLTVVDAPDLDHNKVTTEAKQSLHLIETKLSTQSSLPLPLPLPCQGLALPSPEPCPPLAAENRENTDAENPKLPSPKKLTERDWKALTHSRGMGPNPGDFTRKPEEIAQLEADVANEALPYSARQLANQLLELSRAPRGSPQSPESLIPTTSADVAQQVGAGQ